MKKFANRFCELFQIGGYLDTLCFRVVFRLAFFIPSANFCELFSDGGGFGIVSFSGQDQVPIGTDTSMYDLSYNKVDIEVSV